MRAQAVDVGRHSAVDKVIGAFAGNDFSDTFLVSSGIQPAGMVLKAARAVIPLIVSKAAPINTGIESALQTGVTLVYFAGAEQFSVYSHKERIEQLFCEYYIFTVSSYPHMSTGLEYTKNQIRSLQFRCTARANNKKSGTKFCRNKKCYYALPATI